LTIFGENGGFLQNQYYFRRSCQFSAKNC
jgi:hypothetical protein